MESVSQIDGVEHSPGQVCVESPARLALQQKLVAIRALIEHGINGDADQFPPGAVPPLLPEETERVAHWVEHTAVASFVDSMSRSVSVNSGSRCTIASLPGGLEASWSISSDTTRRTESTDRVASPAHTLDDCELDVFAAAFAQSVFCETRRLEDNPLGFAALETKKAAALSSVECVRSQDELGNDSEHRDSPDQSLSGSKSPKSGATDSYHRNPILTPTLLEAWDDVSVVDGGDFEVGCVVASNFPLRMTWERLNRRLDDPPKYASQFEGIVHALQLG